ncbi:substrate-binding periplasmic protein [Janthinobacterium fluminis]|uniref:Transporter substrate-binding domain-containing protein n=1 Tax=Janthinobacterium fluminis TaxID=2987524 RepID=A0ABT5JXZ4_9BURK|nr:transporter substrate-binding domain-containing protein [Janthinobacterium fluminis]MDC8757045.1 transporter substrate-binding domain-containing protein [Janthinobacterium fluminis]
MRLLPALAGLCLPAAAQTVEAFNTYLVGPYMVDTRQGLAQSLVDRLNLKLAPGYRLRLSHMPRIRLDTTELAKGDEFDGAVLFVNPRFVGDVAKTRFLWSKPLFIDCNLVISRESAPLDYAGPASLEGLRFGGVRGYRYLFVDDLVKAGKLQREDSQDELSGLRKVALARLDVTVVPYTIFSYLGADKALSRQLYVAPKPLQCFARHILVGKGSPALLGALNQAIDQLASDRGWRAAQTYFHLDVNMMGGWSADQAADKP